MELVWKKSNLSEGDDCVEIAFADGGNSDVHVRDSKDPATVLHFNKGEWDAFLAGAKDGEFDL